jgi:uncharacterized protein YjbI with pentapeptide repeats
MASGGKNGREEGAAHGWDLFKWKWLAEPPEGLTAAVYGILFILFFLIAISGVVALWQLLAPIWTGALPAPIAGTDPGAELRGRLLVIGALLTTPFLIWRLIVGHWAARAAQAQARIAQETARNTLFTKAIEQLGATREERKTRVTEEINGVIQGFHDETNTIPNTEIRLGAIYALEKLARDDLEMHWPIMETLCAYIRENAGKPKPLPENIAAMVARGFFSRPVAENETLPSFADSVDPPSVDVQAAISVIGRRGVEQREYERIRRDNSRSGAPDAWRLDLTNCHLARGSFAGLDFTGARFNGSSLYLSNFAGAGLVDAQLNEAHLECATLSRANLEGAQLHRARLEGAAFVEAHLEGAEFVEAHLEWALLQAAHLQSARFEGARLRGASLHSANLFDAKLDEADLREAQGIDQTQIDAAWGSQKTFLPADYTRPHGERWLIDDVSMRKEHARWERWDARRKFWLAEAERFRKTETA